MSPIALIQMDFLLVFSVFVPENIIIVDVIVTLVFVVVDSGIVVVVVVVAVVIIADVVCCLMNNNSNTNINKNEDNGDNYCGDLFLKKLNLDDDIAVQYEFGWQNNIIKPQRQLQLKKFITSYPRTTILASLLFLQPITWKNHVLGQSTDQPTDVDSLL